MDPLILAPATGPDAAIATLLQDHVDLMRSLTPEESCHVMTPSEVFDAADLVITARRGSDILGIGALKKIGAGQGELKSMHTRHSARGQGIARAILAELTAAARARGLTRLFLETGSSAEFAPARKLYAADGFTLCAPFGDYTADPLSVFMTRTL